jgi:hypothetical protein
MLAVGSIDIEIGRDRASFHTLCEPTGGVDLGGSAYVTRQDHISGSRTSILLQS